ncbi:MAG: hydroxychlorobactene glucosyltransferase CruC [Calditrichia bacterium]
MSILLTIAFIFTGSLLVIAVLNAAIGPFLRRGGLVEKGSLVSVLIPARNEAHNITECLQGICRQSYSNLEILVLNDESEDDTARKVREMQKKDPRIRLITGKPLPPGWTGKNWACHQLSRQAQGNIFIFTDADNRHHPEAVARTLEWMQRLRLDGFSAFPQQHTVSFWEKLVIPIIDLFVYSMLPLWLTYYSRFALLSAANGQWLAFTRNAYLAIDGHAAVANEVVEDVELARLIKKKGLKMLTTAGTGMVSARMYHTPREIWEGLSKNLFGLTRYSLLLFILLNLLLLLAFTMPFALVFVPAFRLTAALLIAMNLLLRTVLSIRFRHPFLTSTLLHPLSNLTIVIIGLNSARLTRAGKVTWKGRRIIRDSGSCHQRRFFEQSSSYFGKAAK